MAKYFARFVHIIQDEVSRDVTLVFGENDALNVAKKCFEYGKSGLYKEVRIVRSPDRNRSDRECLLINPSPCGTCSACDFLIDIREKFNFCPNCGRKIVGNNLKEVKSE